MNKQVRKTLDWIQLPFTLATITLLPRDLKVELYHYWNIKFRCEWRKKTWSYIFTVWYLGKLIKNKPMVKNL